MTVLRLSDPQASRAVLIGVHDHTHPSDLPAIGAVERNLTGLADALVDPGIWGLPPEHLVQVAQPLTDTDLLDHVMEVGPQATDTLLVYYAGHGLADTFSDELYLALPASRTSRLDTAFRYEYLRRYLLSPAVKAKRVVVILDCCYSARALLAGVDVRHGATCGPCCSTWALCADCFSSDQDRSGPGGGNLHRVYRSAPEAAD